MAEGRRTVVRRALAAGTVVLTTGLLAACTPGGQNSSGASAPPSAVTPSPTGSAAPEPDPATLCGDGTGVSFAVTAEGAGAKTPIDEANVYRVAGDSLALRYVNAHSQIAVLGADSSKPRAVLLLSLDNGAWQVDRSVACVAPTRAAACGRRISFSGHVYVRASGTTASSAGRLLGSAAALGCGSAPFRPVSAFSSGTQPAANAITVSEDGQSRVYDVE